MRLLPAIKRLEIRPDFGEANPDYADTLETLAMPPRATEPRNGRIVAGQIASYPQRNGG